MHNVKLDGHCYIYLHLYHYRLLFMYELRIMNSLYMGSTIAHIFQYLVMKNIHNKTAKSFCSLSSSSHFRRFCVLFLFCFVFLLSYATNHERVERNLQPLSVCTTCQPTLGWFLKWRRSLFLESIKKKFQKSF